MHRELLSHLPVVLAVSQAASFAGAAARLNMSPSAVSHAVRTVEDALGAPLFARTTRSVALTEAGEAFLAAVGPSLAAMMRRPSNYRPNAER
jgi:DNA-binding transcriptional LysR family regulator